jgi:hypothetical protein
MYPIIIGNRGKNRIKAPAAIIMPTKFIKGLSFIFVDSIDLDLLIIDYTLQ